MALSAQREPVQIGKIWRIDRAGMVVMQERRLSSLTDEEVVRIVAEIDRQGYGTIVNFISEAELQPLCTIAQAAVRTSGGEYVHFTDFTAFPDTVLDELSRSVSFKDLCQRLYKQGTSETVAPEVEFYTILRCLQGITGQNNSYNFHYDSYVLTALLPIVIPEDGPSGDLLIVPSTRPIRSLYFLNVFDKMMVDNKISQIFLRKDSVRQKLGAISLKIYPGNLYFFWGYRSIHTNEPCHTDKLRATALFHYGDPHRNSVARTLIRRMRKLRPQRSSARRGA
jgi:hypothetical protein